MQNINEAERILAEYERHNLEPPADPPALEHCERCDTELFAGDTVWEINGSILCEDCAKRLYSKELGNE